MLFNWRKKTKGKGNSEAQMSFIDHLEELRWHIVRIAVVLLVAVIVMFANITFLVDDVIFGPMKQDFPTNQLICKINPGSCQQTVSLAKIIATDPSEQFTKAILIAFVAALIVTFPYLIWELWRFVRPGLYDSEVKGTRGIVAIVSALFLVGVMFGYYVICPFTLSFFATFQLSPQIQNTWRIGEVISLIVMICLAGGLLFEMPVLCWALSKIGILKAGAMRTYRKHAFVIILIVAGILTPSPDVMSQLLLGIPMFGLYEVSIWISAAVEKGKLKRELAAQKITENNSPPAAE